MGGPFGEIDSAESRLHQEWHAVFGMQEANLDRAELRKIHGLSPDAPPDPDEDEPPPVPLPSLIARNPRTDPQPGDVLSRDGTSRRVIKRDGERVFVSGGMPRYWMRMNRWRKWCAQGDAKVETAKQQG